MVNKYEYLLILIEKKIIYKIQYTVFNNTKFNLQVKNC